MRSSSGAVGDRYGLGEAGGAAGEQHDAQARPHRAARGGTSAAGRARSGAGGRAIRSGRSSTTPSGPSAAARASAPSAPATPTGPLPDTSTSWASSRAVSSGFIWVVAAPRWAAARVTAAERTPPQSTTATRSPAADAGRGERGGPRRISARELAVGARRAVVHGQRGPARATSAGPSMIGGQVLRSGSGCRAHWARIDCSASACTSTTGPPSTSISHLVDGAGEAVGRREVPHHREGHRVADGEAVAADRPPGEREAGDLDRAHRLAVDRSGWRRRPPRRAPAPWS